MPKPYANKFPPQNESEYHDVEKLRIVIQEEIRDLENDQQLQISSQEYEKVPYILEAVQHAQGEIAKIDIPLATQAQDEHGEIVDFEEKKRRHNKKLKLKKGASEDSQYQHLENSRDFLYFYQSSTGENLFLHPLCFKILDQMYPSDQLDGIGQVTYPLTIEAQVLEIEHAIADQDEKEYMSKRWGVGGDYHRCVDHLPDGAPYGFVEIDMSPPIVTNAIYNKFEKQISYREKQRKRRQEREEQYAGKVETIQNDKFEQIKLQAINSVNTDSVNLKPGAIINTLFKQQAGISDEEEKEEQKFEGETPLDPSKKKQSELWRDLGDLMKADTTFAKQARKDTLEGVELSYQARKALEDKKKNAAEFECIDGDDGRFTFASSSITIVEAKKKKKRR